MKVRLIKRRSQNQTFFVVQVGDDGSGEWVTSSEQVYPEADEDVARAALKTAQGATFVGRVGFESVYWLPPDAKLDAKVLARLKTMTPTEVLDIEWTMPGMGRKTNLRHVLSSIWCIL